MAVSFFLPRTVYRSIWSLLITIICIAQYLASNFYDPSVDFVGAVGDLAQFQSTFPGEGVYLVALKFVPQ
jgi:hypothetical protein